MTFYFGKYHKEELGWNTAVGNSVVLLFVAIDLFRYVYHLTIPGTVINYAIYPISTVICLVVVIEAVTLLFTSFFKALPKQVAFFLSAPLPVNLQAYIAVALVYTDLQLDRYTIIAVIVLFAILYCLIKLLQILERVIIESMHRQRIAEVDEEKKAAKEKIREAEKAKKTLIAQEKAERKTKKKKK
jgi:hypothetical protein